MTDGITLKPEGMEQIKKALARLSDKGMRRDLLDQIGAKGVSQTQQHFNDQESPDGVKWPKSLRAIEAKGETLKKSGRLFSSITHNATSTGVEWGTNVVYAGIHQFGGDIKPKTKKALAFRIGGKFIRVKKVTIPARPFLGLSDKDRNGIADVVEDWVQGAWR
ncbi:phage virion morphogenesis protein [Micavibrio aeruginosavorus]|uniref:phage virion morphogenesis protein n=1 Tax=Micavibrio aeruginosavorus TaxID=349221 RepID=UPI003F4AF45B